MNKNNEVNKHENEYLHISKDTILSLIGFIFSGWLFVNIMQIIINIAKYFPSEVINWSLALIFILLAIGSLLATIVFTVMFLIDIGEAIFG